MTDSANKTKKSKKQLTAQINMAANSGIQEMVDKILKDPDNYTPENNTFNFHSKSGIMSAACLIGLQWIIDHPKQAPTNGETNLFAQAVAESLFPRIDARLKTLFETSIANYLNTKSAALYARNILAALKAKLGPEIASVSINTLLKPVNKNIDILIDYEKKQLLDPKDKTQTQNSKKKEAK